MRDTETNRTIRIDLPEVGVAEPPAAKAQFGYATPSGLKVFFLDQEPLTGDSNLSPVPGSESGPSDLYVYDTESKILTDLAANVVASEVAGVQRILGASEDGSIVYFVATGVLASGAHAGADNLYVASMSGSTWSAPRLIATLSAEDAGTWGASGENGPASRVSPNGRFLAFMSDRKLTGYDNRDAVSGQPDEEVFLYDEASGRLTCVSCDPTGARPTGVFDPGASGNRLLSDRAAMWEGHWLAADIPAWDDTSGAPPRWSYQSRYLTDEGRLFFNAFDSLVGQDTNGMADVYEYEPEGIGSCERSGGCMSLISAGTSGEESAFLDASGDGPGGHEAEDVFFVTQSKLTSQDYDTNFDVYDAHTCSPAAPCVIVPTSPPGCSSGDSCKAAPSPQPEIFGPAPSATFSGTGNVVESPKAPAKQRSLTAAQKRARALVACHKKKRKKQRMACERQARKRYPAKRARKAKATMKGDR